MDMASFNIMFGDLNEAAQKEFLEFQGLESAEDGNYDCFPIAILELDNNFLEQHN